MVFDDNEGGRAGGGLTVSQGKGEGKGGRGRVGRRVWMLPLGAASAAPGVKPWVRRFLTRSCEVEAGVGMGGIGRTGRAQMSGVLCAASHWIFLFVFLAIEQPIGSKDDEETEQ